MQGDSDAHVRAKIAPAQLNAGGGASAACAIVAAPIAMSAQENADARMLLASRRFFRLRSALFISADLLMLPSNRIAAKSEARSKNLRSIPEMPRNDSKRGSNPNSIRGIAAIP